MTWILPGGQRTCRFCGKAAYASAEDAEKAADMYRTTGERVEKYFLHDEWHLRNIQRRRRWKNIKNQRKRERTADDGDS
jgi:hypothetical protein